MYIAPHQSKIMSKLFHNNLLCFQNSGSRSMKVRKKDPVNVFASYQIKTNGHTYL